MFQIGQIRCYGQVIFLNSIATLFMADLVIAVLWVIMVAGARLFIAAKSVEVLL